MRLFTGLELPPDVIQTLTSWQQSLKSMEAASGIRWSPAANLHITTKFIGEWPEERLPALREALQIVPVPEPLLIDISGIGSMSNAHHGRIVYAQIRCEPGHPLHRLAADTSQTLHMQLGIPEEQRPYKAHVTLGRTKQDSPDLQRLLDEQHVQPLSFPASEFYLYRSTSAPDGVAGTVYSKLARFPSPNPSTS